MVLSEPQLRGQFAQPVQQITFMLLVIGLVVAGTYFSYGFVGPIFFANPYLNGVILGVFFIGLLACFWQVAQIINSVIWVEGFIQDRTRNLRSKPPRLLAPLAGMLRSSDARLQLSATSARSLLDSVASRMDESRDITRYLTNLLIFLGLLGTFFGLAITVPAIVETIQSLATDEGEDSIAVFNRLMFGLEKQLGGMGTAFSSSLIGLAGSLVVGLLDLLAGHGQNRFYRELEEWLSGMTRVGLGRTDYDPDVAGGGQSPGMIDGLESQIYELQSIVARSEAGHARIVESVGGLVNEIAALTENIKAQSSKREQPLFRGDNQSEILESLAKGQKDIVELLTKVAIDFSDAESRMLLRNIEVQLLRLLEENLVARQDLTEHMRHEIAVLVAAIREQSVGRQSLATTNGEGSGSRERGG